MAILDKARLSGGGVYTNICHGICHDKNTVAFLNAVICMFLQYGKMLR